MKSWSKKDKVWTVRITPRGIPALKGRCIYLGGFKDREEANFAYDMASHVYHR